MVKHATELLTRTISVGVQHLESLALLDQILNSAGCLHRVEATTLRHSVHTNVYVQIAGHSLGRLQHAGVVGQQERTQPNRVHVHEPVELFAALLHGASRNEQVLDDVVVFVQLLHGFRLGELQQGHLDRQQPAEQVAEDYVIAEGDNVLKFVKLKCKNIEISRTFSIFVQPTLIPQT